MFELEVLRLLLGDVPAFGSPDPAPERACGSRHRRDGPPFEVLADPKLPEEMAIRLRQFLTPNPRVNATKGSVGALQRGLRLCASCSGRPWPCSVPVTVVLAVGYRPPILARVEPPCQPELVSFSGQRASAEGKFGVGAFRHRRDTPERRGGIGGRHVAVIRAIELSPPKVAREALCLVVGVVVAG